MSDIVVMPDETGFGGYIRDPKVQDLIDKLEKLCDDITIRLVTRIAKNCYKAYGDSRPQRCVGCRKFKEVFYHPDLLACIREIVELKMFDRIILQIEDRLYIQKPLPEDLRATLQRYIVRIGEECLS